MKGLLLRLGLVQKVDEGENSDDLSWEVKLITEDKQTLI